MPFEVPVVSDNWICWSLFLDEWGEFFLKPSRTTCGAVGDVWYIYFFRFLTPRLNQSLQFYSCDAWRVFGHSNSPPQRALGRYRHTSSFRQIFNIFSWLEILYYYPDGGNGDFQCFNSFLTATFYFVMLNNLVLHFRNIFFGFSHCDGWLREFGLWVPHIYNHVEQEVMAGQFHASSHPGVLQNVNMNGNILQRYFTHRNF